MKLLSDHYLPRYFGYIFHNQFRQTIDDFRYFAAVEIHPAEQPAHFKKENRKSLFSIAQYHNRNGLVTEPLDELFVKSGTTAFLAVKDGRLIDERYFNGGSAAEPSRFMSATKSFLSTLIGIAVDRGEIRSVQQAVTDYIPELKKGGFDKLTLQNLLNMDSGVPFDQGLMPWSIQMKQYFTSDTVNDCLRLKVVDQIGDTFHYNDWYPNLLALVLERASGRKVSEYFESMLWKPMDAENPASLVLDSPKSRFPKMEGGLVATAIDLAKLGRLYLDKGMVNGTRVLSEQWIEASTAPQEKNDQSYFRRYDKSPWGYWFRTGRAYYQNMWWGYRVDEDQNDFFAMGVLGQILYVCPRKQAVFVRLGKDWGVQAWWPTILKSLADSIG